MKNVISLKNMINQFKPKKFLNNDFQSYLTSTAGDTFDTPTSGIGLLEVLMLISGA